MLAVAEEHSLFEYQHNSFAASTSTSGLTLESTSTPNSELPLKSNCSGLPCTSSSTSFLTHYPSSESVDDSDVDPDFIHDFDLSSTSSESNSPKLPKKKFKTVSMNKQPISSLINSNSTETIKEKTRKRKSFPNEWRRNKMKLLRNSGKSYTSLKTGIEIPKRQIGPTCGKKCRLNCSTKFTEEERLSFFNNYWAIGDINKQRSYILNCMQSICGKSKNTDKPTKKKARGFNNAFYFYKQNEKKRVCKYFFISTLGITNRCIRTVISKNKDGILQNDFRGKHVKHVIPDEIKNNVRSHISSIPKIESHYTRAHSDKMYIDGSKTIADLYRDYKMDCEKEGKPFASHSMYSEIFNNEFNLSFFVPKKDKCNKCVAYENADEEGKKLLQEEYDAHHKEKQLSRQEKEEDKAKITKLYQVACFDLQAVLPVPRGEVSSFYYKSKLSTYNFTVSEFKKKGNDDVYCYFWHEGEAKRGANEIGSCLFRYFESKAAEINSDELELVMYSDNCCGQQKNKFIVSLYLYAVAKLKIKSITHKFLVTGHTQNEGDNSHSLIEKNIKRALKSGPIYIPAQYAALIRTAKKSGSPFKLTEMSYDSFFDLKNLCERTAVNFNVNNEGESLKFSQISEFKVVKNDEDKFHYKTSYTETEYKTVNIKESRTRNSILMPFSKIELKACYNNCIPISKKKYQDIQSLLDANLIPKCYSYFYNALLHD